MKTHVLPDWLRRLLMRSVAHRYYSPVVTAIAFASTITFSFPFVAVLIPAVLLSPRRWRTGDAYGDASNEVRSSDPIAGYIPAYTVLDLSATYKICNYVIKAGINNLADKPYFTRRTDEYPGPGIIPAIGRSFYIGVAVKL